MIKIDLAALGASFNGKPPNKKVVLAAMKHVVNVAGHDVALAKMTSLHLRRLRSSVHFFGIQFGS
jgi:hypothetical protein